MSGRPPGKSPDWASDETWSSPGDTWDTAPTKVAPSAGIIAQGFEPSERPPADRFNWLNHEQRKFSVYQDAIEIQNWPIATDTDDVSIVANEQVIMLGWPASNTVDAVHFLAFDDNVFRSVNAKPGTWTAVTLTTPPTIHAGAFADGGASAAFVGSSRINVVGAGGSEIATDTTVASALRAICFHSDTDQWVAGGYDNPTFGAAIAVWADDLTGGDTTTILAHLTGYANNSDSGITYLATDGTMVIAVQGETNDSTDVGWWSSTDLVTWTSHRITGEVRAPVAVWWDDTREAFYMLLHDGDVYKSLDGLTFAKLNGTNVPALTLTDRRVLAQHGGVWLLMKSGAPPQEKIWWSVDEGVSWNPVIDPFHGEVTTSVSVQHVWRTGDRFAITASNINVGDPHAYAMSMICKGLS